MKNTYVCDHIVNYSEIDTAYRMRLDSVISAFQTVTLYHSTEMQVDADSLAKNSNGFWVLCKSRFAINRLPKIGETLTMETWPTTVTPVRFMRDYNFWVNGEVAVSGRSEWCVMDIDSRTVRKTSTVCYPHEMEHRTDRSAAGDFSRRRETVESSDLHHVHTSRFVDVDPNGHTNNVAYVRMALDCFTPEEFASLPLDSFEIYYLSQSYFGDELRLYRKKTDYGYYLEGTCGEKPAFVATLTVKE